MLVEISEHGSVLKRRHDCFIIRTASEETELPAEKVDAIIITANALVSTQAIALCLEKEIQLVLANWSGKPFGRFWASTPGRATEIRRRQYLNLDSQLAYEISKEIVSTKLKEQKKLLVYLKNNRKNSTEQLKRSIANLEEAILKIDGVPFNLQFKQELLGLEGFAASEYFNAISSTLPKKYSFSKRSRNPSRDRFNAILNYAYGYAYSDIEKIVILSGLDPNAGFYHADAYGKPTLVFDIIEMHRAKVDHLVVRLFTKRIVRDSWFEEGETPASLYLSKEGRRNIMRQYLTHVSQLIQRLTWDYSQKLIQKLLD
jgi:CRISPR-associated protein Cas1